MAKRNPMEVKDSLLREKESVVRSYSYSENKEEYIPSRDFDVEFINKKLKQLDELSAAIKNIDGYRIGVTSVRRIIAGIDALRSRLRSQKEERMVEMQTAFKMDKDAAYRLGYGEKAAIATYETKIKKIAEQAKSMVKYHGRGRDSAGVKVSRYIEAEMDLVSDFVYGLSSSKPIQTQLDDLIEAQQRLIKRFELKDLEKYLADN